MKAKGRDSTAVASNVHTPVLHDVGVSRNHPDACLTGDPNGKTYACEGVP